ILVVAPMIPSAAPMDSAPLFLSAFSVPKRETSDLSRGFVQQRLGFEWARDDAQPGRSRQIGHDDLELGISRITQVMSHSASGMKYLRLGSHKASDATVIESFAVAVAEFEPYARMLSGDRLFPSYGRCDHLHESPADQVNLRTVPMEGQAP